jgi:hypothetical protein
VFRLIAFAILLGAHMCVAFFSLCVLQGRAPGLCTNFNFEDDSDASLSDNEQQEEPTMQSSGNCGWQLTSRAAAKRLNASRYEQIKLMFLI